MALKKTIVICSYIMMLNRKLTWTTFDTNIGNMDIGKRKILNKDKETKAVSASNTCLSSDNT